MPELGIESDKRQNLETNEDYKQLFTEYQKSLPNKKEQIEQIEKMAKQKRIALMCFEKDHNHCHRGTLSNNLGIEVIHI